MNGPDDVSSELLLLENVTDGATRNSLALRLAEAKVPGVDQILVRLIQRPDLANNRDTLVHALSYYNCAPYAVLLVDLVLSGGFEVAHEALEALETIDHVDGGDLREAFERFKRAIAAGEIQDWRRPLLDDLAEMFS